MTRNTRGLTRSVIALMVPPFPAPSRPSNTMQILWPLRCTHCLTFTSSTCSFLSFFSNSLRFSGSASADPALPWPLPCFREDFAFLEPSCPPSRCFAMMPSSPCADACPGRAVAWLCQVASAAGNPRGSAAPPHRGPPHAVCLTQAHYSGKRGARQEEEPCADVGQWV